MPPPRSPPRGPAWGPRAGPPWGAPTGAPADPRGAPHGGLVGGRLKGGGMANPRGGAGARGGGRCSERSGNTFRRSVFRTFRVPCKLRRLPSSCAYAASLRNSAPYHRLTCKFEVVVEGATSFCVLAWQPGWLVPW